jgi:hypothetical protein
VAALTAVQLKETVADVTCVGFATPPCATKRIAAECNSYVTTVVADDDMARHLLPN